MDKPNYCRPITDGVLNPVVSQTNPSRIKPVLIELQPEQSEISKILSFTVELLLTALVAGGVLCAMFGAAGVLGEVIARF